MEKPIVYFERAKKAITNADHLYSVTYKAIGDEKLFLSIINKIYDALESSMIYNIYNKTTNREKFTARLVHLRQEPDNHLSEDDFEFFSLITKLIDEHEKSNVEFARKKSFVIASDDYVLHTLNEKSIDDYIKKAKEIVAKLLMKTNVL